MIFKITFRLLPLFLFILFVACESEKRIPPKGYIPVSPEPTEQLEAAYFWIPQDQLSSSYWKEAPYVEAAFSNGATNNLYADGYLNMTGTYNGTADFNKGDDSEMKIRAGYDAEYLYIMVEWKDTTADASYASRLFAGSDDPLKADTSGGWTSQRNMDNLKLLFDMQGNGFDVWNWSMAYTAPLNMALNISGDNSGNIIDDTEILTENSTGNSRSRPPWEWNGERQEISLADSTRRLFDPAYYLLDDMKMEFVGDMEKGQKAFNVTADCRFCHGPNGNGVPDDYTNGGALNDVFTNRYTRDGLVNYIGSSSHEGSGPQYWGRIENDSAAVVDIIAFLRGIAGLPGNTITVPATVPDVVVETSVGTGTVNKKNSVYKVLLRRKLTNANPDDVQFLPENTYTFSLRLSDNDEINYIESQDLQLIFKSNAL